MGNISKLIGSVVGSLIAILMVWLASKLGGTCVAGPDGTQLCTVLGISTSQVTGAATLIISALCVFFFPANKPSS